MKIRNLSLDATAHKCYIENNELDVTAKEFDILYLLLESPSIVVTRSKLLKRIWGYEYLAETRTLDMHIKTLREKISKYTKDIYIETIRGVGYIIKE